MRTPTDHEFEVLFFGLWKQMGGDAIARAMRLAFEMGKGQGEAAALRRVNRRAAKARAAAAYWPRHQAAAERGAALNMQVWGWLFEAVAWRHGTTVDRLLIWKGRTSAERRGTDDLIFLLHEIAQLGFVQIGALTKRNHASAHGGYKRTLARIAANPSYRAELFAAADSIGVGARQAA